MAMRGIAAGFVVIVASGACWAADCAAIQASIDMDLRRAARDEAMKSSNSDEAAFVRMSLALTQAQTNTLLLIAQKCPLPEKPITWLSYVKAAGECSLQAQRARLSGGSIQTDACVIENWKADPGAG
jgi:hypothetical protein